MWGFGPWRESSDGGSGIRRESRLRKLVPRIAERPLDASRGPESGGRDDFDLGAKIRKMKRHPAVSDVLLESWRHAQGGERSDVLPVFPHGPRMREPRPHDLVAGHFDAHEFPPRSILLDLPQRRPPNEVVFLVEVDEPSQSRLVGIVVQVDVGGIVQDPRLDPTVLGWTGGTDVERLPRLHDAIPQLRAAASVAQVNLESDFGGPAGSSDDHRDAINRRLEEVVVL